MKNKYILILIAVAFVSVLSVLGTNAYLMAEVSNTNGYSVGNVKIVLNESNVDEYGVVIDDKRVDNNSYHLMPGYTYVKDPIITLKKNSVDSYIRVLITVNRKEALKDIYGNDFKLEDIYNDWGENWIYFNEINIDDDQITYEYRYKFIENGLNSDNSLEPIFKSFTIPKETTSEQLENLSGFDVNIVGYAIQAEGFKSEEEAWKTYDKKG